MDLDIYAASDDISYMYLLPTKTEGYWSLLLLPSSLFFAQVNDFALK